LTRRSGSRPSPVHKDKEEKVAIATMSKYHRVLTNKEKRIKHASGDSRRSPRKAETRKNAQNLDKLSFEVEV